LNKKFLVVSVIVLAISLTIGIYFLSANQTNYGVVLEVQNVQLTTKELNFTLTFLETKQEGITLSGIEVQSYYFNAYNSTFYVGDKAHLTVPHNGSITDLPIACSLWISSNEIVTFNVEEGKQYGF